jgi:hypothetical protein
VLSHIGAFPNKCTIKTPFSHNGYMKSLEFYENYIALFCLEKNKLFDCNINSEPCTAYYQKMVEITI